MFPLSPYSEPFLEFQTPTQISPNNDEFVDVGFQTEPDLLSIVTMDEIARHNRNPPYWSEESERHAPFYTLESLQESTMNEYPKSTRLYLALGEQFGFHNIAPVPNWLSDADDQSHNQWYKSGPNAFLYFLHKSPKYKKELAKIANTSMFCACKPCIRGKMGNIHKYHTNTRYCSLFWCDGPVYCLTILGCLLYFCVCEEGIHQNRRFYGGGRIRVRVPFGEIRDNDALSFRHDMLEQLNQSGVEVNVPWKCTIWWQYVCCTPCVNIHTENILDYYFYKRYGFNLALRENGPNLIEQDVFGSVDYTTWRTMLLNMPTSSSSSKSASNIQRNFMTRYREKYTKRSRENNPLDSHTYYWKDHHYDGDGEYTGSTKVETTLPGPFPQYKMLEEWTNVNLAVQYHNLQWDQVHKIFLSSVAEQHQRQKGVHPVAME